MKKTKRDIFAEIREGITALADERAGKVTLARHPLEVKPAPTVTADEVLALRQRPNLSRARCSPAPCTPMNGPWKTGNRAARSPMPRPLS